jgi:hypothetical protein
LVGVFLVPAAGDKWEQAEATTVERLNAGVYPFSEHYYYCGGDSTTFRWTDGSRVTWSIFFGRYVNDRKDVGCTHAELYRGWKKITNINFPEGTYVQSHWLTGSDASIKDYGDSFNESGFVVTFANGRTMTVHFSDYSSTASVPLDQGDARSPDFAMVHRATQSIQNVMVQGGGPAGSERAIRRSGGLR